MNLKGIGWEIVDYTNGKWKGNFGFRIKRKTSRQTQ